MIDVACYKKVWSAKKIRSLRKKYRFSRKYFGQLTGVSANCVYLWETGERHPSRTAHILLSYVEKNLKM